MRSFNANKAAASSCAANNRTCNGVCSGYGTQPECPPLIVLAVLSTRASRLA
jgi:predicted metal-binding protein